MIVTSFKAGMLNPKLSPLLRPVVCISQNSICTQTYTKSTSSSLLVRHFSNNNDSESAQPINPTQPIKLPDVRKVRQHSNPLSMRNMQPLNLNETWYEEAYSNPKLPLVIDIGCARGIWTSKYAQLYPEKNVLGLELRVPMAEYCLQLKQLLNLTNLHYLQSNVNVHLPDILKHLRSHDIPIEMLTIQFPDPHFKKRHHKRRVMNPTFLQHISHQLPQNTLLFVQSDVEEVCHDMVEVIKSSLYYEEAAGYDLITLSANVAPYPIQTEREKETVKRKLPVYRMLFVRNDKPVSFSTVSSTNITNNNEDDDVNDGEEEEDEEEQSQQVQV